VTTAATSVVLMLSPDGSLVIEGSKAYARPAARM
jgi:hypothetical protein